MALFLFEQRWAACVGRTFVPFGVLGGASDNLDAGALFEEDAAAGPWHATILLRFALWLVWLAPLWRQGRWRRFPALHEDERAALLEDLLKHRFYAVRQAVNYLKLVSCSQLLGSVRVLTKVGAYHLGEPRGAP